MRVRRKLKSIFSGIRQIPSEYTLKLIQAKDHDFAALSPFGVDVGVTAIRFAQVAIIEGKPQLIDLIVEDLPPELWGNPLQRKRELLR